MFDLIAGIGTLVWALRWPLGGLVVLVVVAALLAVNHDLRERNRELRSNHLAAKGNIAQLERDLQWERDQRAIDARRIADLHSGVARGVYAGVRKGVR